MDDPEQDLGTELAALAQRFKQLGERYAAVAATRGANFPVDTTPRDVAELLRLAHVLFTAPDVKTPAVRRGLPGILLMVASIMGKWGFVG